MTFDELASEIIALRFKVSEESQIKRWINIRYAMVWGAANWPFKYVTPQTLAITAGDTTPSMPADFHRVLPQGLRDDSGNPLRFLEERDFNSLYQGQTAQGTPQDFTLVNEQIYLGPIPSSTVSFTLGYERRIAHKDNTGAIVAGLMSADSDEPIWTSDHHFLLVPGAMATGLKLQADPTWGDLEDEFERMLSAMVNHYLPPDQPENLQYGSDPLGYELASWG